MRNKKIHQTMDRTNNHTEHRHEQLFVALLLFLVLLGTIFVSYQISRGEMPPAVQEAGDDDFSMSGATPVKDVATVTFAPLGSAVTPKTAEAQSSVNIQQNTSGPFVPSALLKTIVYPFPSVSSTSTTSSSFQSISSISSIPIIPHPAPGPFGSSLSSFLSSISNQSSSFSISYSSVSSFENIQPAPPWPFSISSMSSVSSSAYVSSSGGFSSISNPFPFVSTSSFSSFSSIQLASSSSSATLKH